MSRVLILILGLGLHVTAHAEYRAFLLRIEKLNNPEEFRLVQSNLDPLQYADYYPVQSDERIFYIDTWMCRGRYHRTTGYAKICESPRAKSFDEATEPTEATVTPPHLPTSVEKLN